MSDLRDYWVDITLNGVDYVVGANLHTDGDYTSSPDGDVINWQPTFSDLITFDPETDKVLYVAIDLRQEAHKHLCNVYWNEIFG